MSDTKTERPTPERLSDYITACSDGHCILRDPSTPRGQHTNGGCRHLKERGPEATKQLMAMGAEIVGLRAQVAVRSADLEKERAIATDALRRATEAELGCDVLATGDPYERLASTLEAARMVENERDSLRKRCHEAEREAGRQRSIADALRTDLRCMTTRAWFTPDRLSPASHRGMDQRGRRAVSDIDECCSVCFRRVGINTGDDGTPPVDLGRCAAPGGFECRAVGQAVAGYRRENEVLRSNSDHLSSENASLSSQVESMAMRIESLAEELAKPEDARLREVLDALEGRAVIFDGLGARVGHLLDEMDEWIERAGAAERRLKKAEDVVLRAWFASEKP